MISVTMIALAVAAPDPLSIQDPSPQATGSVQRYAIVVGNNVPEAASGVTELRFADDDAIAFHNLLREAAVVTFLLAVPDRDSQKMRPGVASFGRPSLADLERAVVRVVDIASAAAATGALVEFFFYFSGHGDVDNGEGYLVFEDGRLTRTKLMNEVLARVPSLKNHVILDACKSYFMAFAKGPGGTRVRHVGQFAVSPQDAPITMTGFVLSTSSDRESHEWERFQSGIFSHELRSALRGGADVNGDARISYEELGAFLVTANESIANPRFRPDFMVQPPGGTSTDLNEEILAWSDVTPIRFVTAKYGHLYVETAVGERLLDLNAAAGATFSLYLPSTRPLFVRTDDEARQAVLGRGHADLVAHLRPVADRVSRKGALHRAFRQLFSTPFGPSNVSEFRRRFDDLDLYEATTATLAVDAQPVVSRVAGITAIAAAAVGLAAGAWALERNLSAGDSTQQERADRNQTIGRLQTVMLISFPLTAVAGATWLVWPRE